MPKRNKNEEMEKRLGRIEENLASRRLNDAIRQLGDGLDIFEFEPSRTVQSLSLYQSARIIDGRRRVVRGVGYAKILEGLYGQILSAFEAHQKEKASEATIDTLAQQATVDDKIERIDYFDGHFSYIYRTKETRMLDEKFMDSRGKVDLVTSTLMNIFGDIANKEGYFAGVRVNELRFQVTASDLEQHVMNGFVALKKFPEDKMEIAVPVRFY